MDKRKIILFGGTFDPIHIAHTEVAAVSAKKIGAEIVFFIPAKKSPLKQPDPVASDNDRLQMIKLAIADNPHLDTSDYELRKGGLSYTIETVSFFKELLGKNAVIYWLMGADNIAELDHWYKINELLDECSLAVMYRAGFPRPDFSSFKDKLGAKHIAKLEKNIVATPLIDISSTEIRKKIDAGEDVSNMVELSVIKYIKDHNLYRRK